MGVWEFLLAVLAVASPLIAPFYVLLFTETCIDKRFNIESYIAYYFVLVALPLVVFIMINYT